jgi:hypothetical protein
MAKLVDETMVRCKNDLDGREDINGIIQWPIRSRFGIKRPTIVKTEEAQACLVVCNAVHSYICTRDLVQEYIAFRVLPLVNEVEILKEIKDICAEGNALKDLD